MGRKKKEGRSVGVFHLSVLATIYLKQKFVGFVMTLYHLNQIFCWAVRKRVGAPIVRRFVRPLGSDFANDR